MLSFMFLLVSILKPVLPVILAVLSFISVVFEVKAMVLGMDTNLFPIATAMFAALVWKEKFLVENPLYRPRLVSAKDP